MNISVLFPSIVGVMYAITAIDWAIKGNWPWALTWGAYALANVGLVLASKGA